MVMAVSPPGTPEGTRITSPRPVSMYSASSPDVVQKTRPQSMISRAPPRSTSRMSMASSKGGTRISDEDTKTSVRVVVRVRPPLSPSDPGYELIPQRFQRSTVQVPTPTSLSVESSQGRKLFIFDRVFNEETSQKGIWDYLEDSVDSFLQGYNVSILAYGQSGAGKSYTMGTSGPAEQLDVAAKGIIPRAASYLFENLDPQQPPVSSALRTPTRYSIGNINSVLQQAKSDHMSKWQMAVTYVEIYNEQPRDLLLPEGTPVHERAAVQIREDPKGRIFVEGLKSVPVRSVQELMAVLNHGSVIRQTDATAVNSRSSRSHAVFTVSLRQTKPASGSSPKSKHMSMPSEGSVNADNAMTVESKLHFVDLAGSERLKNTGATGDRAKEGISINAGLASLGKVISQLSSRSGAGHVSYRDSKLTRMLQDSLGGSAITYMVACVTPAEFHLSETLNTVQYAQRARNIQSKPKIQRINEDGDKQATIERLRSEVAFLRQQIRSSDDPDRRNPSTERNGSAEMQMQNQLLDVQESYRNLSERHAKLVAELSATNESHEQSHEQSHDLPSETAAERLKRSQENQQQIESIILEYEKTIQSLEASLSNTRSSLSVTESSLLEKETKCAYIETMNQQLNSRVQKLMDREANTETYLHELEARLEDSTSGGEKHDALLAELRKEMARIRQSETNAEDYICTLEERLAEADQDIEIMQREVERLEQLVERQRSLGKLDNLLYELDNVQRAEAKEQDVATDKDLSAEPSTPITPITPVKGLRINGIHNRKKSEPMEVVAEAEESETQIDDANTTGDTSIDEQQMSETESRSLETPATVVDQPSELASPPQNIPTNDPSPAQTKFMQEKFENVSQELFDLRLEHESTVNEFDMLSAKYSEALRTLAEMQDHLDEVRHSSARSPSEEVNTRPQSFLDHVDQHSSKDGERSSSSRSLSSELSSVGELPASRQQVESSKAETVPAEPVEKSDTSLHEIERLHGLLAEHEQSMTVMKKRYSQLHDEHKGTLDTVEKLKSEAHRNRASLPPSPNPSMIRRSTSQLGSSVERGQRSIITLRSILAEEFEDKPDRLEGVEVHLSAATHEMQTRIDRIQNLETEMKNMKKEMDMKSTLISGLTRERNSLKSGTPVDLSMVSQMRDQLIQKETELKNLHEGYGKREQELQTEILGVRKELETISAGHQQAIRDLEARDARLQTYAVELAAALASAETLRSSHASNGEVPSNEGDAMLARAAAQTAMNDERKKYQSLIEQLKSDLERQTATNSSHAEKITELTQLHESASEDIHHHSQIIQEKSTEIDLHKVTIAELKHKIKDVESAVEFHKHGLKTLHEAHANEVEEMKLSHAGALAGYDDQIAELGLKHKRELDAAGAAGPELQKHQATMKTLIDDAGKALGHPTSAEMVANHIQDLAEEKRHVMEANKRLISTNTELENQLNGRQSLKELEESVEEAHMKINNYQDTIRNLANEVGNHEETIRDAEKVIRKHEEVIESLQLENKSKIILIEELEQQLQNSYDQHQNRVSVIQNQGSQALVEAQNRISQLEKDLQQAQTAEPENGSRSSTMKSTQRPTSPHQQEANNRTNSINSNLRKSASIASLPSPPPAIPLPPLPTLPGIVTAPTPNLSPPQSRHTSKEVSTPVSPVPITNPAAANKDSQTIKRQSAIIEDQESRLRTMEKHLHAEKQLTATLEEALVDLETQSNKLRVDAETWKKKAWNLEEEMTQVRKERRSERLSIQAVEEEVKKRREAEAVKAQLEERMRVLSQTLDAGKGKKKRAALNCF